MLIIFDIGLFLLGIFIGMYLVRQSLIDANEKCELSDRLTEWGIIDTKP